MKTRVLMAAVLVACSCDMSMTGTDGGSGGTGGNATGGGIGGGSTGGGVGGGSTGGGIGGGVGGGSTGGGIGGGSTGGGIGGGSTGGGIGGGSTGGGVGGGSTGGGVGGGSTGGGVGGGSTGGGVGGGALTLPDGGMGSTFVAVLKGTNSVPSNNSTATGLATVIVDDSNATIVYRITHSLAAPTAAHIHQGIATVNGGVIVPFAAAASPINGTASVTVTQANALRDGLLYVNIHSSAFPNGELRGQLVRPGEMVLRAVLSGAEVVPPVTTNATGGIEYLLNVDAGSLRAQGFYGGLVATQSTLYAGDAGTNGTGLAPIDRNTFGFTDGGLLFSGENFIQPPLINLMLNGQTYAEIRSGAPAMPQLRGQLQPAP